MGNEQSRAIDEDAPPQTLKERSLAGVAGLIKDGQAKRIVVMTGAGISTAAGIPDFRSPETGLYHNLARLNLPFAEAVFEIDYFRSNPIPFYMLAKELYPGKFAPTISHTFIALLSKKCMLRKLFTQNIDCLERFAGVPGDDIIEAHGSFATQRCIDCKAEFPGEEMRDHVVRCDPPHCKQCNGLVKPDIVFFGEQLPSAFYENRTELAMADLVLVLGTSLSVHPFASLPTLAVEGTPRVLFNMEKVGDFGTRADDVVYLGDCDSGVRKLADELGWREELERMWTDTVGKGIWGEEEVKRQLNSVKERNVEMEKEMALLIDGVEHKLGLSAQDEKADTDSDQVQVPGAAEESGVEGSEEKAECGPEGSANGSSAEGGIPDKTGFTAASPVSAAGSRPEGNTPKDTEEVSEKAADQPVLVEAGKEVEDKKPEANSQEKENRV